MRNETYKMPVTIPVAPGEGCQMPSDGEIEAATKRLTERWGAATPVHASNRGSVVQSLAHGRSRAVAVEVKRPGRRPPPTP